MEFPSLVGEGNELRCKRKKVQFSIREVHFHFMSVRQEIKPHAAPLFS